MSYSFEYTPVLDKMGLNEFFFKVLFFIPM